MPITKNLVMKAILHNLDDAGRTVGAALRGRPAWNAILCNRIDEAFDKEIDSTPGGHGGPPLQ